MKACNVHVAKNKEKILILLYSSKTHGEDAPPQKMKIKGANQFSKKKEQMQKFFCPFSLMQQFIKARGGYSTENEQFFIFRDGFSVFHFHVRKVLRSALNNLGLQADLYNTHSLQTGRCCDLLKYGYTIEEIKLVGRWKSNSVFTYLKNLY